MIKKIFHFLLLGVTLSVSSVHAQQSFTCERGWTLNGSMCTLPGNSQRQTYTPVCNNGGSLEGLLCVKVITTPSQTKPAIPVIVKPAPVPAPPVIVKPAPVPAPPVSQPAPPVVRWTCPDSSWKLNGSTCSKLGTTTRYTPSPQCPRGGPVLPGGFCESYNMGTKKIEKYKASQPCPRGGVLSANMCVLQTPGQTIPASRF